MSALSPYNVGKPTQPLSEYRFGVAPDRVAQALRDLADDIDRGALLVQELREEVVGTVDDFVWTHVTFRFHEKQPKTDVLRKDDDRISKLAGAVDAKEVT